MIVCGVDTETTGLDTKTDCILELGAVLWDTDSNKPLLMFQEFIYSPEFKELTPEASKVNGLSNEEVKKYGKAPEDVFRRFHVFANQSEFIVAHNGLGFDKPLIDRHLAGIDLTLDKPWIDSKIHVPYGSDIISKKLIFLAALHGFVNPFPHRAVTDVLTMLRVCSYYNWDEIKENASQRVITVRAMISFHDLAEREFAKTIGYLWDGVKKMWYKTMLENQLEKEREIIAGKFELQEVMDVKA